ncbi:MAG: hypothetical protein ACYDG4_17300 [Desulfuromonadaceae bacterium]
MVVLETETVFMLNTTFNPIAKDESTTIYEIRPENILYDGANNAN